MHITLYKSIEKRVKNAGHFLEQRVETYSTPYQMHVGGRGGPRIPQHQEFFWLVYPMTLGTTHLEVCTEDLHLEDSG